MIRILNKRNKSSFNECIKVAVASQMIMHDHATKHTLVSSAASVAMDKGAVRPRELPAGANAAAELTVARKATVENFIFLVVYYLFHVFAVL
jgi:hypothetical protein